MALCRVCGAEVRAEELLPVTAGGGCTQCNGSPSCSRCGHPRRQHRGTFSGGSPACTARVAVGSGLALGRCGCPGYTSDAASHGEPVEVVEVVEPSLRLASEGRSPTPAQLPPVRDLFDSGKRLRDLSEFDGVPWRPPD